MNLQPVITWLENGCNVSDAIAELKAMQTKAEQLEPVAYIQGTALYFPEDADCCAPDCLALFMAPVQPKTCDAGTMCLQCPDRDANEDYKRGFHDGAEEFKELYEVQPKAEPASDVQISEWASRHDFSGSPTDLRCAFDDAKSLAAAPVQPKAEPVAWRAKDANGRWMHGDLPAPDLPGDQPELLCIHSQPKAEPAQEPVTIDVLTDKIAGMLNCTYHCTRVWGAWHVGTMSEDDFQQVDESDTPREIAEAVHALYAAPVQPKAEPAQDPIVCVGSLEKEVREAANRMGFSDSDGLYAAPQALQPLDEAETRQYASEQFGDEAEEYGFMRGVRYAEAAHGIKGGAEIRNLTTGDAEGGVL